MLNFILGPSYSGKSKYIHNKISSIINNKLDQKILLIVPEQISFEIENLMFDLLGAKKSQNVEVLSFKWLTNSIFREYGGISNDNISNSAKALLMMKSLSQIKNDIKIYSKMYNNNDFINSILSLINKFKINGISADILYDISDKIENSILRDKIDDIKLIYKLYDMNINSKYQDSNDYISIAANILEEKYYFKDYIVFFDEFDMYTYPEYRLIENIVINAKEVYFSLRYDNTDKREFFDYTKNTYNKLKLIANKNNIKIGKPILLDNNIIQKNKDIQFLLKNIFSPNKSTQSLNADNIYIANAKNNNDELCYIASTIIDLVKNNNYRYNDIAIITNNIDDYKNIIKNIFDNYELPYFMDTRSKLKDKPIIRFSILIFKIIISNFGTCNILSLFKIGLIDIDNDIINKLENYVYLWNIDNDSWKNEFKLNPLGFKQGELDEESIDYLNEINIVRKKVIDLIVDFKLKIKSNSSNDIIKYFYSTIINFKIDDKIQSIVNELYEKGDINLAEDYIRSYEIFIDIINILYDTLDDMKLTLEEFYNYLIIAIDNYEIGTLPKMLDSITICQADRSIYYNFKVSFIIGVNNGIFPSEMENGSIITRVESDSLVELGLELTDHSKDFYNKENFIIYKAMASAKDKIYITYSEYNQNEEFLKPSIFIDEISNMFKNNISIDVSSLSISYFCKNKKMMFNYLACNFTKDNEEISSIINILSCDEYYLKKIEKLDYIISNKPYKILDQNIRKNLFGSNIILSPSKIENFYRCKFRYFCKYILNILSRKRVEFNPIEMGKFIHYILYTVISDLGKDFINTTLEELQKILDILFFNYMSKVVGGIDDKSSRFIYLYNRTNNIMLNILLHIQKELSQSKFIPSDFELDISFKGNIKPLEYISNLGKIFIEGRVDRVDIYNHNNTNYIRIIDYKSSDKDFNISDVYYGLNLQMLLYLFSIVENGKGKYENSSPAGILYMPTSERIPILDRNALKSDIEREILSSYKMKGLLIDNIELIDAMDKDISNVFINAKLKKGGELDKNKYIFSTNELEIIRNHVENLVINMIEQLNNGNIEAKALTNNNFRYCSICEYNTICGKIQENNDILIKPITLLDFNKGKKD